MYVNVGLFCGRRGCTSHMCNPLQLSQLSNPCLYKAPPTQTESTSQRRLQQCHHHAFTIHPSPHHTAHVSTNVSSLPCHKQATLAANSACQCWWNGLQHNPPLCQHIQTDEGSGTSEGLAGISITQQLSKHRQVTCNWQGAGTCV